MLTLNIQYDHERNKKMWTTEKEDYWLVEIEHSFVIFQVSTVTPLIIENEEELNYVTKNMMESGVKIVTNEDVQIYLRGQSSDFV